MLEAEAENTAAGRELLALSGSVLFVLEKDADEETELSFWREQIFFA